MGKLRGLVRAPAPGGCLSPGGPAAAPDGESSLLLPRKASASTRALNLSAFSCHPKKKRGGATIASAGPNALEVWCEV